MGQSLGQANFDAPRGHVDLQTNFFCERDQNFTGGSFNLKQRRPGHTFSWKENIADGAQHARGFFCGTSGERQFRSSFRQFKHRATHQIADEILARGKLHAIRHGNQDVHSTQLFRRINGRASRKVENPMLRMIAIHPEMKQAGGLRLGLAAAQINLFEGRKAFRKIREKFGQNFPFIAAWTNDARDLHPALRFERKIQSSSISSVKRLWSFMPAAPSSVRMALAVRPWRPMTLPKSSRWTRNSSTVTWDPSTAFT